VIITWPRLSWSWRKGDDRWAAWSDTVAQLAANATARRARVRRWQRPNRDPEARDVSGRLITAPMVR
jgi:hypothetical protein